MTIFAKALKLLHQLTEAGICKPRPGLTAEEITAICEKSKTSLPPSVAEWWTYCNGVDLFSAELYGIGGGWSEFTAHWKERDWTPIAGDGCGSNYLVVKVETRDGLLYPVVFADHEHSVIEENGENQLCNQISYIVASDLPHFLEAVFLNELHDREHPDRDDDEYLNFWWPFDKDRIREFDPNIEKAGIVTPWAANVYSILDGIDWLLQKGNWAEARKSLLRAAEEAREKTWVSGEMVHTIELLAENGFIRDTLNVIRSLPPSYERSNSFCYITFCKSEHFDCTPEEAVETALDIAEEGFNILDGPLPPERCDRYFAHYVDGIFVLINHFAAERCLKNAEIHLDHLLNLVQRLTDPMDRILSFNSIALGFCRNGNNDIAKKINDETMEMVKLADANLWDEWEFYHDNSLTYENVLSWVEGVKKDIEEKMAQDIVTIEKIVKGSNEAEIQELVLHNNYLTVKARLPYYGQANYGNNGNYGQDEITVALKTKAQVFDVQIPDARPLSAHFRLDRLEGIRANSWGYYVPSDNKDKFFWSIKNGFALAFGRHIQKYQWLFRIIFGEGHIHVLLVKSSLPWRKPTDADTCSSCRCEGNRIHPKKRNQNIQMAHRHLLHAGDARFLRFTSMAPGTQAWRCPDYLRRLFSFAARRNGFCRAIQRGTSTHPACRSNDRLYRGRRKGQVRL